MNGLVLALVLSVMLTAAPVFAQAPAQQAPAPQGQAPAPAQPAPAPATQAPQPAPPAAVPAPKPFPEGTKYAFVNIQRVANESNEGKSATARVQALNQQKVNELNERNKALQALQAKLDAGANVLSVAAAAELQKNIERQQVDIQRFTEDAQQEVALLQQQLQDDFQRKLTPIIQVVAVEKGLHMLFSVADSGLVWGEPSLDLTTEIIAKFNAAPTAAPAATTPAPAPRPPAAPAPAPTPAPAAPPRQ
jgi:outer membrane protein